MIRTQLTAHCKNVETLIGRQLQQEKPGSADFRWYLSLHIDDVSAYDAKIASLDEHENPYASILSASSTAPSLYASSRHYQQYQKHNFALSASPQPSALIKWINATQPHSHHHLAEQQIIPRDVIENTPFHVQAAFKDTTVNEQLVQSTGNSLLHAQCEDDLTNNTYVDTVLENIHGFDALNLS